MWEALIRDRYGDTVTIKGVLVAGKDGLWIELPGGLQGTLCPSCKQEFQDYVKPPCSTCGGH